MGKMRKFVIGWMLFVVSIISLAQDDVPPLTESFTEPTSGVTIMYPADWLIVSEGSEIVLVNSEDINSFTEIQPDEMAMQIVPPLTLDALVGGVEFEEAWEILRDQVIPQSEGHLDITDYQSVARFATVQIEEYTLTTGLVELDAGVYALVLATAHPDTLNEALPIYYAIGGSVTMTTTVSNTLFANTQPFEDEAGTFAFSYPAAADWHSYEEDGVGVATNAGSIEQFAAETGQYLIIMSAVPRDQVDEVALITGLFSGFAQNITFPMPPILMKPDGTEVESLGGLEGLIGKSLGVDFSSATALIGQPDDLPDITLSNDQQSTQQIMTESGLVAIVMVFGPVGEDESVNQILNIVSESLRVPVDLSGVAVSDTPLTEEVVENFLVVHHPEGWDSFVRGGFNVVGVPPGASDPVRLIMSARQLESGESVEDALHSFVQLMNYEVFDMIELSDGRVVHIGASLELDEAVLTIEYGDGFLISMSYLPANANDFMVGLPLVLAILESIELQ